MKNKICLLISALLFLAAILIFTSCNSDDETTPLAKDEHVHVFSDGYMKSETEHWRYAVCEHKDEIIDKAEHLDANFDGFCDTCLFVMCSHSYGDPYERDSETHAYDPVCGCALDPITEEHKDEDKDGKCDMCNYETEKAEDAIFAHQMTTGGLSPTLKIGDTAYFERVDPKVLAVGDIILFKVTTSSGGTGRNVRIINDIYDYGTYYAFSTTRNDGYEPIYVEVHQDDVLGRYTGMKH